MTHSELHEFLRAKGVAEHRLRGLTYRALAGFSGRSPVTIWRWVTGRSSPTMKTIETIASALGVSPKRLL